jgi:hypothetical protein
MNLENKSHQPKHPIIRALLRKTGDGLSVNEIQSKTGIEQGLIRKCLGKMPDAYIDRWTAGKFRAPPTAIWCVVEVPENCPRPRPSKKGEGQ